MPDQGRPTRWTRCKCCKARIEVPEDPDATSIHYRLEGRKWTCRECGEHATRKAIRFSELYKVERREKSKDMWE